MAKVMSSRERREAVLALIDEGYENIAACERLAAKGSRGAARALPYLQSAVEETKREFKKEFGAIPFSAARKS